MIEIEDSNLEKRVIKFWKEITTIIEEKMKVKVIAYSYGKEVILRIECLELKYNGTISFEAYCLKEEFVLSNVRNMVYFEIYRKIFREGV